MDRAASWAPICPFPRLPRARGVGALVHGAHIAVFRTPDDALHALANEDPFVDGGRLAEGVLLPGGEGWLVRSPASGRTFALPSGRCLEDPAVTVRTYAVRVSGVTVEVAPRAPAPRVPGSEVSWWSAMAANA